jgi:hypothetical protein
VGLGIYDRQHAAPGGGVDCLSRHDSRHVCAYSVRALNAATELLQIQVFVTIGESIARLRRANTFDFRVGKQLQDAVSSEVFGSGIAHDGLLSERGRIFRRCMKRAVTAARSASRSQAKLGCEARKPCAAAKNQRLTAAANFSGTVAAEVRIQKTMHFLGKCVIAVLAGELQRDLRNGWHWS